MYIKNKAVFLDRDGVINSDIGHYYIYKLEDFTINKDVIDAVELLYKNDFLIIVISNQGGIDKKIYTKKETELLHNYLIEIFGKRNIKISEIYYCPHHSDISSCICRKPDSLLLEKAIARFNIDPDKSYFIGDSERDILAAEKVNIKGIKIKPNESILKYCKQIKVFDLFIVAYA